MFCAEDRLSIGSKESDAAPTPIANVSCFNEDVWELKRSQISLQDLVKSSLLLAFSASTIVANLIFLLVLRSTKCHRSLHVQPRYFLTAMSLNCILNGCCLLVFSVYPSVVDCWPFGEIVCQLQAVLFGALNQHFCVLIMAMSIDRYYCLTAPLTYSKIFTGKFIGAFIGLSWLAVSSTYLLAMLPPNSFAFSSSGGVRMCEPFYGSNNVKTLSYCLFFFVPTLVLMHYYGSMFHSQLMHEMRGSQIAHSCIDPGLKRDSGDRGTDSSASNSAVLEETHTTAQLLLESALANPHKHMSILHLKRQAAFATRPILAADRRHQYNMARSMAAISLTFIIVVTPWTLKEIVVSCTGASLPSALDFCITFTGMTYVLWTPFVFCYFSPRFASTAKAYVLQEIFCRRPPEGCCSSHEVQSHKSGGLGALFEQIHPMFVLPDLHDQVDSKSHTRVPEFHELCRTGSEGKFIYPLTGKASSTTRLPHYANEEFREQLWGEILERSLSLASLADLGKASNFREDST